MKLCEAVRSDLCALGERESLAACAKRTFADPSFATLLRWRVSCSARRRGPFGKLLAKLLWKRNVRAAGCFLSPLAELGPSLVLPHATGIVVGDGVQLGGNVTIYQNVTLGRKGAQVADYPVLGNSVVIFAGACVLGSVMVGDGAVVAANAVVIADVMPGSTVGGVPAHYLRGRV